MDMSAMVHVEVRGPLSRSLFSLSAFLWVLEIKLRSLGLCGKSFFRLSCLQAFSQIVFTQEQQGPRAQQPGEICSHSGPLLLSPLAQALELQSDQSSSWCEALTKSLAFVLSESLFSVSHKQEFNSFT